MLPLLVSGRKARALVPCHITDMCSESSLVLWCKARSSIAERMLVTMKPKNSTRMFTVTLPTTSGLRSGAVSRLGKAAYVTALIVIYVAKMN